MHKNTLASRLLATSLLGGVLALGTAASAGTYSEPIVEPQIVPAPVQPAYNWTGGYAGVGLGFVGGSHDWQNTAGTWENWPDSSGPVISGLLGYNWQGASSLVYGVELLVQGGNVDGSTDIQRAVLTSEIGTTVGLRGRIGVASDRTLVFATLGGVNSEIEYGAEFPGGGRDSWSERVNGLSLGVGFERAMANGWNLRGDLEHYRYSDTNYDNATSGPLGEMRARANVARVSYVRRF